MSMRSPDEMENDTFKEEKRFIAIDVEVSSTSRGTFQPSKGGSAGTNGGKGGKGNGGKGKRTPVWHGFCSYFGNAVMVPETAGQNRRTRNAMTRRWCTLSVMMGLDLKTCQDLTQFAVTLVKSETAVAWPTSIAVSVGF